MDHPAVSRAGSHTELWVLFHQKHIVPPLQTPRRNRAPNHAPANNQNVSPVHLPRVFLFFRYLVTSLSHYFASLSSASNLIEIRLALHQFPFTPIMHRVLRPLARFVSIAPQRSAPVHSILVQRVKVDVKRPQFLLVVLVVVRHARPIAPRQASVGDFPCRIISMIVCPPEILMFSSPFPVEPAAPTSLSTQHPAPMIGESPTRPGIFHASPDVVVVAEMSPLASTAMQGIVPVGGCAITF